MAHHALTPIIDAEATTISPISSPKNPCKTLTHDRRCKGFKKAKKYKECRESKSKSLQRSQQGAPSLNVVLRCSLIEIHLHPAKQRRCPAIHPRKRKRRSNKASEKDSLMPREKKTLASSTVDSNVLTVWSHYMIFFSLFSSL